MFNEPGSAFEAIKKTPIFVFRVIGLRLSMEIGWRHSQNGFPDTSYKSVKGLITDF